MPYSSFWKGVHPRHPRFTRKASICWRYFCWWAANNLDQLPGGPPRMLMRLAGRFDRRPVTLVHHDRSTYLRFEASGRERAGAARFYQFWFGPFSRLFQRIASPFRTIAGANAHRCDFTDRETGLLYGGDGAAMNLLFAEFSEQISPTEVERAAVAFAVDDLHRALTDQPAGSGTVH